MPLQSHQALIPIVAGSDNRIHPASPLPSPNQWPQPDRAPGHVYIRRHWGLASSGQSRVHSAPAQPPALTTATMSLMKNERAIIMSMWEKMAPQAEPIGTETLER